MIVLFVPQSSSTADLAIQIPGNLNQDGIYRFDYNPPHGVPSPNTTIASRDIGDVIEFSQGLPGTKYEFWLYYSNNTRHDLLTWTASITTGKFVVTCGHRPAACLR
jgi:cadherin 5 type 2 (VE-cadherin)